MSAGAFLEKSKVLPDVCKYVGVPSGVKVEPLLLIKLVSPLSRKTLLRYLGLSYLADLVTFENTPLLDEVLIAGAVATILLRLFIIDVSYSLNTTLSKDGPARLFPKESSQFSEPEKAVIVLLSYDPANEFEPAE
jgi:hypothetical protein